jgi:hypothetical protein
MVCFDSGYEVTTDQATIAMDNGDLGVICDAR